MYGSYVGKPSKFSRKCPLCSQNCGHLKEQDKAEATVFEKKGIKRGKCRKWVKKWKKIWVEDNVRTNFLLSSKGNSHKYVLQ